MDYFSRRYLNPFTLLCGALLIVFVYLLSAEVAEGATVAPTLSVAQLQAKYQAAGKGGPKVKILIVPGHEPDFGGTEYQNLKERDINVAIANRLALQLKQDPHFTVIVARDTTSWNQTLTSYFSTEWDQIQTFITDHKNTMQTAVASGAIASNVFQASHNTAATDVATRLYGITKWADENGVDIAVHVHLNDAGDHVTDSAGNQSGFAVYVPDVFYGNAATSHALGSKLASELNHYSATSSLAVENLGVAGDQDLIALGAYNTASYASVLVEYAYIYESKITNPTILPLVEKDFANSTYRGIEEFFGRPVPHYDTLVLPHRFTTTPKMNTTSAETYALQVALHRINLYPTGGELYYDCPVGGYMGPCTVSAIQAFQKSKGLTQTGALGPATRKALNAIWGG